MKTRRPQELVFTLFGEYLLGRRGPVWVGSLISLLQPFGLSEGAVRTVLSRMARKGWLVGGRRGRHAFYDLSGRGRTLLEAGQDRIFRPKRGGRWDGEWFLLAYSIPEDQRHLRDRLRVRLAWLGFGSLGNGLWLSPYDLSEEVGSLARDMDVDEHLECFRARHLGNKDPAGLVARSWDLEAVNGRYASFMERWEPELQRSSSLAAESGLEAQRSYGLRFRLIHEFREFPLEDPYLPTRLLPADWRGTEAAELVDALHDLFTDPADRYVDAVLAEAPLPSREA
jgi:phenylacetic acid degradation operon negative regulatory protein